MVLLRRLGYTTIKYLVNINGEERGGNDSEGDNKGGKRDMTEPSPREEGDDGPPPAARVHNNQILS
jgi:hypothetical protein